MKLITDLNGTILCPYQIIHDFAEQVPNALAMIKPMSIKPICTLESTNDWINLESYGQPVALRARELIELFCAALVQGNLSLSELEIHLDNAELGSDNLFCLIYLSELLKTLSIRFVTRKEAIPQLSELCAPLDRFRQISISFEDSATFQKPDKLLTILDKKRLSTIASLGFSLDDKIFHSSDSLENMQNQLIGYSWLCLKAGAYSISCTLLYQGYLLSSNKPSIREHFFMHLLMMRFFSHQYSLIAETKFPEQFLSLSESDTKTLYFLTAYSATLSRNLPVAKEFFQKCSVHKDMPLSDEQSLYQLNNFALFQVLEGDVDTAFTLEFRIKDFIEKNNISIVGLNYVNNINIARLYKKANQFNLSEAYYNKAYKHIGFGGFASSDHIYYNMNLGSLYEAQGNFELALTHWINATIHWLSFKNKYALSWRPRIILCQEKITDLEKPLPIDKANAYLYNKIVELLKNFPLNVSDKDQKIFSFIEDNDVKDSLNICYIHKNCVLFTTNNAQNTRTDNDTALAGLTSNYLRTVFKFDQSVSQIIVDTQLQNISIKTKEQAQAFISWIGVDSCYFDGEWLYKDQTPSNISLKLTLSKRIQKIFKAEKGMEVQFQRSFLNTTLKEFDEIDSIETLHEMENYELEELSKKQIDILKKLAKKRVIQVSQLD